MKSNIHALFVLAFLPTFFVNEPLSAQPILPTPPDPIVAINQLGDPVREEGMTEPPAVTRSLHEVQLTSSTFYDHGDPTVYEQLLLELLNRARADPGAEAVRRSIDLNDNLAPGTIEDTPKQPLAMHRLLIDGARDHSQWMLDTDTFSHTGAGGSTISDRIVAAGYELSVPWAVGENISLGGTTGIVDPLAFTYARHTNLFRSAGHRENMMDDNFEEVGMGIREGIFVDDGNAFNTLMATQKFGRSGDTPSPFLLGVAFYDFNGNDFYDIDEAIAGVTVMIEDSSYYTETTPAGGYTLPMPAAAGTREVTFSGPGFTFTTNISFPGDENVKVDFVPPYEPPQMSGTATPSIAVDNSYSISTVLGATEYQVFVQSRTPASIDQPEDLSRMIDGTSSSYSPYQTDVKHSEPGAYQLAHAEQTTQRIEYENSFYVQTGASLQFQSRLRGATVDQIARVEVSADEGRNWSSVDEHVGSGWPGEGSFSSRSVSLASYEGEEIRVRFSYYVQGPFFSGSDEEVGWFIDDVELLNVKEIENLDDEIVAPGEDVLFAPTVAGDYWLQVRPWNFDTEWPMGPALMVTAVEGSSLSFGDWASDQETASSLPTGTLSDPEGDYSGDGVRHLMAYVLDLDPAASYAAADLPAFLSEETTFAYWINTEAEGAILIPQLSVDLENWYDWDDGANPVSVSDTAVQQNGAIQHRHLTVTSSPSATVFVRLRAEMLE